MKHDKEALVFFIEEQQFETFDRYKTGAELKQLGGIPLDTILYLAVQAGYEPDIIENDERVDLARTDIEKFFVKTKLKFTINGKPFVSYQQYITGRKLRELGNIPEQDDIYLDIVAPFKDDLITDDEEVDLARPGKENFFSKPRPFEVTIIVNGRPKKWQERTISYDQVVALAKQDDPSNSEQAYSVNYFDGPAQNPKGELAKGQSVFVTNEMIFNATSTDKS